LYLTSRFYLQVSSALARGYSVFLLAESLYCSECNYLITAQEFFKIGSIFSFKINKMKYGYLVVELEEMIGTPAFAGTCTIISKLFEDIE